MTGNRPTCPGLLPAAQADEDRARLRRGAATGRAQVTERGLHDRVGSPEPTRLRVHAEAPDADRAETAVDGQIGRQRCDADVVERYDRHAGASRRAQPRHRRRPRRVVDDQEPEAGVHDRLARRGQDVDAKPARRRDGGSGAPDRDPRRNAQDSGEMEGPDEMPEADAGAGGDAERDPGRAATIGPASGSPAPLHFTSSRRTVMTRSTSASSVPAESGSDSVRSETNSVFGNMPRR
jgi:hypothetical protein